MRRIHYAADGTCHVQVVAGSPGSAGVLAGPLTTARLNHIAGLAFSPSTLDLYATDDRENVVVRIRY